MSRIAAAFFASVFAVLGTSPAEADDPPSDVYFIAMRALDLEPAPRYASVVGDATDQQNTPVQACDGDTYYASADDAPVILAALSNGNTVELVSGPAGTAPANTSVICLIQAGS